MMSLDRETEAREASEEAAAMAMQERFMIDEVEDVKVIQHLESAEDDHYRMALGTYEQSLQLLNISDRTAFPFLGVNPISLGRSKENMYAQIFPTMAYSERQLLYVTETFEYFVDGQRFNKKSRRWSYYPTYMTGLLWSLSKIGAVLSVGA
jgi:hypothetical protein